MAFEKDRMSISQWRLIAVLFLLFISFIASSTQLTSYDFWWHLKTGDVILETKAIPVHDPFSFTSHEQQRIPHDWLSEVAFSIIYGVGGIPATIIFKALLVMLAFFFILLSLLKSRARMDIIILAVIFSLWGARFRFTERPEVFSLFMTSLILFLLYDSRLIGSLSRSFLIITVTILWINLHGSAVLAPLFFLLFIAGELLNRITDRRLSAYGRERVSHSGKLSHLVILAPLVFLATAVNPAGIKVWKASFEANFVRSSGIAINPEWMRPESIDFPLFYAAVTIFLITAALSFWRLDFTRLLITVFLMFLALIYLRMIGLFFMALPFFLAVHVPSLGITARGKKFFSKVFNERLWAGLSAISIVFSIFAFLFLPGTYEFGYTIQEGRFPESACDFLEKNYRGEFLYNDVRFGGYLIWRFYPEQRVFIDGRNELYEDLIQEIHSGLSDHVKWVRLLERYHIDAAIVSYWPELKGVLYPPEREGERQRRGYRAYSAFLFQKREWALVYWDDISMVFFKRNESSREAIERHEYRYINPEDWSYILERCKEDPILKKNVVLEIERRMLEKPFSRKAAEILTKFRRENVPPSSQKEQE